MENNRIQTEKAVGDITMSDDMVIIGPAPHSSSESFKMKMQVYLMAHAIDLDQQEITNTVSSIMCSMKQQSYLYFIILKKNHDSYTASSKAIKYRTLQDYDKCVQTVGE